jgi:hypothetical protein
MEFSRPYREDTAVPSDALAQWPGGPGDPAWTHARSVGCRESARSDTETMGATGEVSGRRT